MGRGGLSPALVTRIRRIDFEVNLGHHFKFSYVGTYTHDWDMRILVLDPFRGAAGDMITEPSSPRAPSTNRSSGRCGRLQGDPSVEVVDRAGIQGLRVHTGTHHAHRTLAGGHGPGQGSRCPWHWPSQWRKGSLRIAAGEGRCTVPAATSMMSGLTMRLPTSSGRARRSSPSTRTRSGYSLSSWDAGRSRSPRDVPPHRPLQRSPSRRIQE